MYALLLAQDSDEKAVLSLVLQRAGLATTSGNDLERALRIWPERPADLILFALRDEACASVLLIRGETTVPLIVIRDQTDEDTHYRLLESGADLVLTRPFSARLLVAQVRALSRRSGNMPLSNLPTLTVADLTLDPGTRSVQVADRTARRLTHLEFRLLYTLMVNRGQVLSPDSIVDQVWGYSGQGDRDLVRGLIRRLRKKVEPVPSEPRYILTEPGLGYSIKREPY